MGYAATLINSPIYRFVKKFNNTEVSSETDMAQKSRLGKAIGNYIANVIAQKQVDKSSEDMP